MGYYCYKRKAYSTHTTDVIVMLVVALMLLSIPWLFTREVVVVEEKKTNWSALVTPILVLLILLLLSLIGSPERVVYAKPKCYRCYSNCLNREEKEEEEEQGKSMVYDLKWLHRDLSLSPQQLNYFLLCRPDSV
ncbi:hypothetical protein E2542_SST04238 [Spatholobus suberectus]|nr:hypothetical protein E2542_SST04238 [Spatholobus suberectus]